MAHPECHSIAEQFSTFSATCKTAAQFQARRAVSTTNRNFAHWSSSVSKFPSIVEANPHCGLSARFSSGTNFARLFDPPHQIVAHLSSCG